MNEQQNQGNGWVGGSIGTGLGVLGAFPSALFVGGAVKNALIGKEYDRRSDKLYDKKVADLGYVPQSRVDFGEPYIKAQDKISQMYSARAKQIAPYEVAATLLTLLGTPITAGLLGASLTD
jgi:hypothetical protein